MIDNEKMTALYYEVINGSELITQKMYNIGFSKGDLTTLINRGCLKRIKRGHYSFIDTDALFKYGKHLLSTDRYKEAFTCFEKCHELDHSHSDTCFQLLLRRLKSEDYTNSFELIGELLKSENVFYQIDARLYLYLLSTITDIPKEYRQLSKFLGFDDIAIPMDKIPNEENLQTYFVAQNKIRKLLYTKKFTSACHQLNNLLESYPPKRVQDLILKELTGQAIEANKPNKEHIINLVREKRYVELIKYLTDIRKIRRLSRLELYTLSLARDYTIIKANSKYPIPIDIETENIFQAIDAENYELALKLSYKYKEEIMVQKDNCVLNYLLTDICSLINSLPKTDTLDTIQESEHSILNGNKEQEEMIKEIIDNLKNNQTELAINLLEQYLKLLNKEEYKSLIINLIKISTLERDSMFQKPEKALSLMSRRKHKYYPYSCVKEFYNALYYNQLEIAEIYLDIIKQYSKLELESINVLERTLKEATDSTFKNNPNQRPESFDTGYQIVKK